MRGRVAEELRNLLITDRRYLDVLLPTIEGLVCDPNISVRACAISSLFGVALYNEELAVALFQSLSETDDVLLGSPYAEDFIRRGLSSHMEAMRPHIERMLHSENANVCQTGARLAALAGLIHRTESDLAAKALHGVAVARLGVAEIAEFNFTVPSCREWGEQTLCALFNDEDIAVQKKAAHCFWHLWRKPEIPLTEHADLILRFLQSAAFARSPSMLLRALEDSNHRLPEVVLDVCEHFVEKCAEQARDIRTHRAGDEHTVGPLVFRAYQQLAGSEVQLRALQLIDRMCEEGLHSASQNMAQFER
ncbi:MAG: hypothetical protein QM796_03495 [Chthoniobacteraceae bacterium]